MKQSFYHENIHFSFFDKEKINLIVNVILDIVFLFMQMHRH